MKEETTTPAAGPQATPAPAPTATPVPTVLEYADEKGRNVKLHQDGTCSFSFDVDSVSKEIFPTLLAQFALLNQVQTIVAQAIKLDLKGEIRLVTASDDKNIETAEIVRERLVQVNRAVVMDNRRRSGQQPQA